MHNITRVLAVASLATLASAQSDIRTLLDASPGRAGVREVTLSQPALAALNETVGQVRLHGFPMPHGGSVDLLIEEFEVLTPDAQVVIGDPEGDIEIGRPDVTLYRGTVEGDADSTVFLSFSPHGTHGIVRQHHNVTVLTSGPSGGDGPMIVGDLAMFPEPPEFAKPFSCSALIPDGLDVNAVARDGEIIADNPCRIARVAIDSDYEYTAGLFGGNVDASAAYCVTIIGAVGEIFTRDVNVRLMVPFVRVWADDNDPYNGGDLSAFRTEWNANMGHVERDLAHKLSGAYGGGVAWVSVLCHPSYGYALSGVGGSFPYPLEDHQGGNWDPFVVAHELGHNFGTLHTHDGYDPPIDGCGNSDCTDAYGGTIMSYCHICSGGMTNISLRFHERVITQISGYMDGACDLTGDGLAYAYDDDVAAAQDLTTVFDVLRNDVGLNCDGISIVELPDTSQFGGSLSISEGTGDNGRDEVIYTPAPGFTGFDTTVYTLETTGGVRASANIYIEVTEMREPDALRASLPGLAADYYALSSPQNLPDFDALAPYLSENVSEVDYASTGGTFAGSGRADQVGAVFEGAFVAPETGFYTLSIESDDGSRLYVGDEMLIDNDGLHGMVERSGDIGLQAGPHRLRVEFFENGGGAGLIVRAAGPGMPRQAIPESNWRNDRCAADWDRNNEINTQDLLFYLADWNLQTPNADVNADGVIDTRDVVNFLNAWSAGC